MSEHLHLSEKQLARVDAIAASSSIMTRSAVDAMDLVSVARYIETGEDPWLNGTPPPANMAEATDDA